MRKIIAYGVIINLILLIISGISAMGETSWDSPEFLFIPSQQENISEPAPMNLYLYGGDAGELKPEVPLGNSSTEVDCPGYPLARMAGYYIGTWTSSPLTMPVVIGKQFLCSLWAYSSQGATNVRFNIQVQVNGNERFTFQTESTSLSQTPTELRGDTNRDNNLELSAGDTFGVRLAYFSDPARGVGPGASSTLIVGSDEYDPHITITTSLMSLFTNVPVINVDTVTFSATFIDAFSATRLHAHIMVDGVVDVITISEPIFSMGENGSLVSWDWNFKTDRGRDGEYTIMVSLCYGDENDFKASGTYYIEFHEHEEAGGIIESLGILFPIIIIAIIAVVLVIVVRIVRNRRADKTVA